MAEPGPAGERIKLALESVSSRLGYAALHEEQEAVNAFASGRDVFISLPTGSGKSLCFAVLPWLFDRLYPYHQGRSIVIIVSPLIALMKDQVESTFKFATLGRSFAKACVTRAGGIEHVHVCALIYTGLLSGRNCQSADMQIISLSL